MPKYSTNDIRNIALVGHGSTGKTSLAEAILFNTKQTTRRGSTDEGTSVSDYLPDERERKASLDLAILHAPYKDKEFNLLDAPGYPDFLGGAYEALSVAETAVIVISAPAGIEVNTRIMWEEAEKQGLARVLVINKMDADNVDYDKLFEDIRTNFGNACVPLTLPVGQSGSFSGVVSTWNVPDEVPEGVLGGDPTEINAEMMESVLEADDTVLMKYLEGEEITTEEIQAILPKALVSGTMVPVFCTNAREDIGLTELMDFLADFAPSPASGRVPPLQAGENEMELVADATKDFVGRVFKVTITEVGRRSYIRVFQGKLTEDTSLYKVGESKSLKPGHLYKMQGKEQQALDEAIAGDLCSLVKVEGLHIGDTVVGKGDVDATLPTIKTPRPMCALAVYPVSQKDEQKIGEALTKLTDQDLTLTVDHNAQTRQTVLSGMSNLHLDVMLARLKENLKVEVETKPPKIPYLETVTSSANAHYRHKKQTGGAGQFGEVYIKVEPKQPDHVPEDADPNDPLCFLDEIVGGVVPNQFIPAVEKGVREAMNEGILAGYPVKNVTVRLYDGKTHPVDSKEIAFKIAGRNAFREGFMQARPSLLEPIVNVEVTVPSEFMGDIIGDLNGRRGQIQGMEQSGTMQLIKAKVPQSEMMTYATDLRSRTGGQGMFTMEPSHYEPVPNNVQAQVVEQAKRDAEEEEEGH